MAQELITGRLDSNPQFKAFASSINYAIIVANSAGNIIDHNNAALEIFGYKSAELIGKPLTILMPERFRALHLAGLKRYTTTHVPKILGSTISIYAQHKDGHEFPIEIALSSWKSGDEQFFTGCIRNFSSTERYAKYAVLSLLLMTVMLGITVVNMLLTRA